MNLTPRAQFGVDRVARINVDKGGGFGIRRDGQSEGKGSGFISSRLPTAPLIAGTGAWLEVADHCAAASSFPGGKDENTGSASTLSDRLTMGTVEVISSDPLKLPRPNRGAIFSASCPLGNRV